MSGRPPLETPDDPAFNRSLQQLLRNSEGDIDFISAAQLKAARARAIDAARNPPRATMAWWTVPGAAIGAAMLVWMLLPGRVHMPSSAAAAAPPVEVIETLADDKTTGVYDDLEFYQWLADTDGHG